MSLATQGARQDSVAGPWAHSGAAPAPLPSWNEQESESYTAAFSSLVGYCGGGDDLRVTFVGQRNYFGPAALPAGVPGLRSSFVDYTFGTDPGQAVQEITELDPHVLIAFRPEMMVELLQEVRPPLSLGVLTEPVLTTGWEGHQDLKARTELLDSLSPELCSLFIGFNPSFARTWGGVVPVWTCMPLPVCDDIYCRYEAIGQPATDSGLFVGRVTERRNQFLGPLKHHFDWTVVDHGMRHLDGYTVAVNLHNEDYGNFENRVPMHLARGHLVLTEPLTPSYELQEGINLLEFSTPTQLAQLVSDLERHPEQARTIAVRGRQAAESFRASRLWSDRLMDLSLLVRTGSQA